MQPWRTGGSFSFGGFWESIKSVALMLFSLGLLSWLAAQVLSLLANLVVLATLGHPPAVADTVFTVLQVVVMGLVPVMGTYAYVDWRWGWKGDNIGAARKPALLGWALLGLLCGVVLAILSLVLGQVVGGGAISFALPNLGTLPWIPLLWAVFLSLGVEVTFRGAVISRFQADLSPREILIGAVLAPFVWYLLQAVFGTFIPAYPWTGIGSAGGLEGVLAGYWPALMSVALSLLFLRTDSVWLSVGLRLGMTAGLLVLDRMAALDGAVLVWGLIAVVLLLLEWSNQRRMPRRVQGNRGPRVFGGGRTVRGPWGPH